jgi:hypothetical protein
VLIPRPLSQIKDEARSYLVKLPSPYRPGNAGQMYLNKLHSLSTSELCTQCSRASLRIAEALLAHFALRTSHSRVAGVRQQTSQPDTALCPHVGLRGTISTGGNEPRRMLTVFRFGDHCSCRLQGETPNTHSPRRWQQQFCPKCCVTFHAPHPRKPKLYSEQYFIVINAYVT